LLEALPITDIAGDQIRKLLGRSARFTATLRAAPGERAKLIRALVERIIVDDNRIAIKVRRSALLAESVAVDASDDSNGSTSRRRLQAAWRRKQDRSARVAAAEPSLELRSGAD
jgi:hypothetical protein